MNVLAIDGGGIRGLIPAIVLAEFESRTGRRMGELVDMIAGTSTGSIIACALARPDPMPAQRIAELYEIEGPRIFDRSLIKKITSVGGLVDERYDSAGLVDALTRWLGPGRLADLDPPVLLTAYDIQARRALFLGSSDVTMIDAVHASSAAPSYFEPVRIGDATLVDGGVFATNPAVCAYAQVGGKLDLLLSLGTGEHTRPLPYDEVRDWGQLEWARADPRRRVRRHRRRRRHPADRTAPRRLRAPADAARRGERRPRRREPREPRRPPARGRAPDRRERRPDRRAVRPPHARPCGAVKSRSSGPAGMIRFGFSESCVV